MSFFSKPKPKPVPLTNADRRGRFRVLLDELIADSLAGGFADRATINGLASDLESFAQQLRFRLATMG